MASEQSRRSAAEAIAEETGEPSEKYESDEKEFPTLDELESVPDAER